MCIRDRMISVYQSKSGVLIYKSRKRGQPTIRWLGDVLEDLRRMDMRGYYEMAMDRRLCRRLVLEDSHAVEEEDIPREAMGHG